MLYQPVTYLFLKCLYKLKVSSRNTAVGMSPNADNKIVQLENHGNVGLYSFGSMVSIQLSDNKLQEIRYVSQNDSFLQNREKGT